jgi:lipid-A-disaccharide synthase
MTRLLVSAAEGSADAHLAKLACELRRRQPDIEIEGFGGKLLAAAGCRVHEDLIALASMGIGFLANTRRFFGVVKTFDRLLGERRPDAVLLVDSPGLHLILARLARWRDVPVVYYICPQIWAWAPWRRSKVLRYTDLLLVILPFEADLYRSEDGPPVVYVGHPLGDSLAAIEPSAGERIRAGLRIPPEARVIGIFPGSREAEVRGLMPLFRTIIDDMGLDPSRHRLLVSSFREGFRGAIEEMLLGCRIPHEVLAEDTRAIALASDFVIAKSGTASLEVAYFEKPMVVLYRVSRLGKLFFRLVSVTPYFALPNILGASLLDGAPVVPERLLAGRDTADLAALARSLLDPGPARDDAVRKLRRLKESAFAPGANARAADVLLRFLERSRGRAPA